MSLFDLFRSEAQSNAQVLNQGLLALDHDLDDLGVIEPLMRAAHSIKGAARIVNLEPIIGLAHAMEDCLVAAQNGQLRLTKQHIDQLLVGVDLIGRVAAVDEAQSAHWLREQAAALAAVAAALAEPQAVVAPLPQTALTPAPATSRGGLASLEAPVAEAFKVGAQNFDQILALASETRVIGHSLQPLLGTLQGLKMAQQQWCAGLALGSEQEQLFAQLNQQFGEQLDDLERFERRLLAASQGMLDEVLAVRMRPFRDAAQAFPRLVRDLARGLGKEARLEVEGLDTRIDREVLARLEAPLNHLLRNAVDHGIEEPEIRLAAGKPAVGSVRLEARHVAGQLHIQLSDDGRGVDPERIRQVVRERHLAQAHVDELDQAELLEFLLLPAFSLKTTTSELSGRGVGLDVVADTLRLLEGRVLLESFPGQGFRTTLVLPVTRSIVRSLVVTIAAEAYALPISHIEQVLRLPATAIHLLEGKQFFLLDEARIGLVAAEQLLGLGSGAEPDDELWVLVIGKGAQRFGLVVEAVRGEQSLAVKSLESIFGKLRDIASAAVLEDGTPVLVLDVADLLVAIDKLLGEDRLQQVSGGRQGSARQAKRVLVVDDSLTVREMERKLLQSNGFVVEVAVDGMDGWNAVRSGEFDLLVTDVDMPRMNGIELVELIRKDVRLHKLPIMIVSYKDRPEDRARGLEAGADYYLTKGSFHDDALIDAVHDLIGDP
ncbi:MAG: response regulator [Pseudomonas sp.]|uniref:hybrid sensor histidine kinase/response regulator n=1 Tax=Pseudomonas sp. TaxID=306 RepID=UPI0033961676